MPSKLRECSGTKASLAFVNSLAAVTPPAAVRPIAVMVVDDSAVVRGFIARLIQGEPDMTLVAQASDGAMALDALARHPADVVVLDIEMPVMDGLTALPKLLALRPGVKVVIASTLSRRNAEISLRALSLGAADYIPKPEAGSALLSADDFKRELLAKVRAFGARRHLALGAGAAPPHLRAASPAFSAAKVTAVAIGGSTGAPPMLLEIFRTLKGRLDGVPIFVTQHMPPTFTALLAEQLARAGGRPIAEGLDGETVAAGRAYVAPGGRHMTVTTAADRKVVRLLDTPPENFCRPAVDPMLRSLSTVYGAGLLAVILSGLGVDGAAGCQAVSAGGGRFAVQDEATSVIWGMPGAAHRTGLSDRVLPLSHVADYLIQVVEGRP